MAEGQEEPQPATNEEKASDESQLDIALRESAEYKDKYLRLLAETENMRKRMQKEKMEFSQYAIHNVIAEFLTPLDHLENALKFTHTASEEVRHWSLGFQMILTQFKDVLANHGVIAIEAKNLAFDPHIHEAVEVVETSDALPGIVIEEFVKGYKMGDRIIRPARVKVSKAPASPNEQNEKGV